MMSLLFLNLSYGQSIAKDFIYEAKRNVIEKIKDGTKDIDWAKFNIEIYPTIYLDINCANVNSTSSFILDSTKYLGIIRGAEGIYEYYGDLPSLIYQINSSLGDELFLRSKISPEIEFANSQSETVFFVTIAKYFLSPILKDKIVCYLIQDVVHYQINEREATTKLETLLIEKLGSVEKFCELKNEESNRHALFQLDEKQAKLFLQKSYRIHLKYFPTDTLKALNMMIMEMKVTQVQGLLLRDKILNALKGKELSETRGDVMFYNDVTHLVNKILTKSQFCSYLNYVQMILQDEAILSDNLFRKHCSKFKCDGEIDEIMRYLIFN